MYRSSPFRSTLNRGYITGLDMCKICTEAVHSVALEHGLQYRFGHVENMYRSSPFRSTLNTGISATTAADLREGLRPA